MGFGHDGQTLHCLTFPGQLSGNDGQTLHRLTFPGQPFGDDGKNLHRLKPKAADIKKR